jgi:hypothetical protein
MAAGAFQMIIKPLKSRKLPRERMAAVREHAVRHQAIGGDLSVLAAALDVGEADDQHPHGLAAQRNDAAERVEQRIVARIAAQLAGRKSTSSTTATGTSALGDSKTKLPYAIVARPTPSPGSSSAADTADGRPVENAAIPAARLNSSRPPWFAACGCALTPRT